MVKKKLYQLNLDNIINEIDRIEKSYETVIENINDDDIELLREYNGIERLDKTDAYSMILDIYVNMIDPLLLAVWLFYPVELLEYIKSIDDMDRVALITGKLSEIALFGTDQMELEFHEYDKLPSKIFPFIRQYNSVKVRIEKLFAQHADYDRLLLELDQLLADLVEFISEYENFDENKFNFHINVLCEFERVIPILGDIYSAEQIREILLDILDYTENNKFDIATELLRSHLNLFISE